MKRKMFLPMALALCMPAFVLQAAPGAGGGKGGGSQGGGPQCPKHGPQTSGTNTGVQMSGTNQPDSDNDDAPPPRHHHGPPHPPGVKPPPPRGGAQTSGINKSAGGQ